jgi:CheY-like chemotaxis protein
MKTILLVDDDLQVRTMFGLALRRIGYNVLEADSGSTGLAMARQHLPDLILTDVHMPGGDGSTLLHDIRHDPELRSKQVVMMTGRPDLITPRKGMEDGADDFLSSQSACRDYGTVWRRDSVVPRSVGGLKTRWWHNFDQRCLPICPMNSLRPWPALSA